MTAGIFFTLGMFEGIRENEEKIRIEYVDKCIRDVNKDLKEQLNSEIYRYKENFDRIGDLSGKFYYLKMALGSIKNMGWKNYIIKCGLKSRTYQ